MIRCTYNSVYWALFIMHSVNGAGCAEALCIAFTISNCELVPASSSTDLNEFRIYFGLITDALFHANFKHACALLAYKKIRASAK